MNTWTLNYTTRYTDNGDISDGILIAPTTYQEARKEFAMHKHIMRSMGYKMTRFSGTEYGFANKYSTQVVELVQAS